MTEADRPHNPRVIITHRLPAAIETRMSELFDTVLAPADAAMDRAALLAAVSDCDVLVPTLTDQIDATLIAAAGPRLKLIANFGNGVDHIDLKAARARGIIVTNTPGVLTQDAADMAMALLLSIPRRVVEGERRMRSGEWTGWRPTAMLGHRIHGKTLGIIGMGRIGQAIALRARGFGLSIRYHNRHRLPDVVERAVDATFCPDLDAMLGEADFVSLNCPHNEETHHLLDRRRIALLRRDAYLINIARGELIEEGALIDALEQGRIAGAGLDVFAHEPAIDPRLRTLDNVVLLPHMASATIEAREDTGSKVIANIRMWADGHRPPDQVLEGWA
ncbi:D-glycerate dehydrogenase [Sphingomonas sp. LaA6.9]|uniref:2-hydroxyacid dehydrogenase n=1 Tax=Sphingomonas sp. LaA6.9 TaxID=2919914 RepID=UPI001F4F1803|nr:D-glycerate dehydrogenase [Sphingomonas sp. LaA6.9]MCJ8155998.1 D-glycerate dehydrogenase [Sphingomonas sp. LaA6.9]